MKTVMKVSVFALVVMVTMSGIAAAAGVVPTSMPVSNLPEVLGAQTGVVPTSMPVGQTVLGATKSTFGRTLSLYAKGGDVKALQQWLNANGYPVATTGPGSAGKETTIYGRGTAEAVKKLQSANGLKADGAFGAQTRALIKAK